MYSKYSIIIRLHIFLTIHTADRYAAAGAVCLTETCRRHVNLFDEFTLSLDR